MKRSYLRTPLTNSYQDGRVVMLYLLNAWFFFFFSIVLCGCFTDLVYVIRIQQYVHRYSTIHHSHRTPQHHHHPRLFQPTGNRNCCRCSGRGYLNIPRGDSHRLYILLTQEEERETTIKERCGNCGRGPGDIGKKKTTWTIR